MMKMQGCMTKSAEIMTAMNQYVVLLSILINMAPFQPASLTIAQAGEYQGDQRNHAEHGQGDGARKLYDIYPSYLHSLLLACPAAQEYVTRDQSLGDR
jgi:hypothetical protein